MDLSLKKSEPKKVFKEKFEKVGALIRFGQKGSAVLPLDGEGNIDWKADRFVIWDSSWEALKKGNVVDSDGYAVTHLPVFRAPYRPKPEA